MDWKWMDGMRLTALLNVKVNGNAATIAGATQPLKIDLTAPARWWQYAINNGGLYWISINRIYSKWGGRCVWFKNTGQILLSHLLAGV